MIPIGIPFFVSNVCQILVSNFSFETEGMDTTRVFISVGKVGYTRFG